MRKKLLLANSGGTAEVSENPTFQKLPERHSVFQWQS
jgi:hypothetical protein